MSRKGKKKKRRKAAPVTSSEQGHTCVKEEMESDIRLISVCESVKINKKNVTKEETGSENFHFL